MKKTYTATYEPRTMGGEAGFWYRCHADGRLIFEGWSRGSKPNAEAEVREGINAREALLAATRAVA
jgi:hypothetical protein